MKAKFTKNHLILKSFLAMAVLFISVIPSTSAKAADNVIRVDASSVMHTIPADIYGNNMAIWEGSLNGEDATVNSLMAASGQKVIRYPGGSYSDIAAWDTMGTPNSPNLSWTVSHEGSIKFAKASGATLQPIVNFGGLWDNTQHTHEEAVQKAVDWVIDMNVTRKLNIKNWEIGNEIFGPWEDGHTNGRDYGLKFANFYKAMKAVDPTISIGAVAVEYDDGAEWGGGYQWWMRDMLTAMKETGVIPDFLIIHTYPNGDRTISTETDRKILGYADQIGPITSQLNTMIGKYLGDQYVGKIKFKMTEYRLGGSTPHMFTFVDTLFNTTYMMEMARYGWTGANIWNIKNGMDQELGGDFGMISNPENKVRSTYYIFPLLTKFGSRMVSASATNSSVRTYASKDEEGNLTILMLNNSFENDLATEVNISGFKTAQKGEKWLLESVTKDSSTPIQQGTSVRLNGVVDPEPTSVINTAGITIKTGSKFIISLPKCSITIVKIPASKPKTK
ncbi:hypothetical protein [Paenibacillus sp. LHD-38]|uniref:hypothetical protein n=1 Tax=Paenibacillus sp. LHD-38 TaxID=3072143 RepID=UPI00280FD1E3|nr:hypothetical protein [Paenibacillus sp. LHD-38]MDQ8736595.1 hypothetical protein [Paenibacillus sp. LHD-38]